MLAQLTFLSTSNNCLIKSRVSSLIRYGNIVSLDIIPDDVKNFYTELTEEDKVILKEIAQNHATYENEDQALEALKAKSEKLHAKAIELRDLVKTKIDSLKADAKAFVESVSFTQTDKTSLFRSSLRSVLSSQRTEKSPISRSFAKLPTKSSTNTKP
jgi:predicted nuclease with TOPRIM domain